MVKLTVCELENHHFYEVNLQKTWVMAKWLNDETLSR